MSQADRPHWQLPPGVCGGTWDYVRSDHIAEEYDDYFAGHPLFSFDESILDGLITTPGVIADLGCGTGRAIVPLARRGFPCLAIDLSAAMLRVVQAKARQEGLPISCIQANLVQLDPLRDDCVDYAICLFSTIGMIHGREHRLAMLRHVRRIVRPGGTFILHVHNFWNGLWDANGRSRLVRHLISLPWRRGVERGDKYYRYRGLPNMYLHTFTRGEIRRLLRSAGFQIQRMIPLQVGVMNELPRPWLLGRFRANGWVIVCR